MTPKAKLEAMPATTLRRLIAKYRGPKIMAGPVVITREMAIDALTRNQINRPVRPKHVEFVARQLREGRWRETHQGIAFSPEGDLLDGQHRLMGLVESDIPEAEFTVAFNVPRESYQIIDFGNLPRTLGDVTGFDRKVLEPVAFLYRESVEHGTSAKFDLVEFGPYWAAYGQLSRDLISYCGTVRRGLSAAPIKAAAVFVAKATDDDTAPFEAYRNLVFQDYQAMPPAVQTLNRQIVAGGVKTPVERWVRAVAAFERLELERLQVRDIFAKARELRAKVKAIADAHRNQVWKIKS